MLDFLSVQLLASMERMCRQFVIVKMTVVVAVDWTDRENDNPKVEGIDNSSYC